MTTPYHNEWQRNSTVGEDGLRIREKASLGQLGLYADSKTFQGGAK